MSNLLSEITTAPKVEEVNDNLGATFGAVDSGIYTAVIKYAYLQKSAKGALGLHMELELDGGQIYQESIYLTKQTGENFYVDKKDNTKKHLLPGYITADAIALFGAQKPIAELDTEEMIVKLYDYDQKANIATPVPMLKALIGKTIQVGIIKRIKNKQVKGDNGQYADAKTGIRESNEIDKVFHPTSNYTVPELRTKAESPAFYEAWKNKWNGKVDDKSTNDKEEGAASGASTKPSASSLFK